MADKTQKVPNSVPGKWYVDSTCIACNSCCTIAPDHFKMNDDETAAFVQKQPITPEEEQLCIDAKDSCPVDSIGNDEE